MNDLRPLLLTFTGIAAVSAVIWWLWPVTPVDTPYFHWQRAEDDRYALVVSNVAGNPEFRAGVPTTPVPHSGTLRVSGTTDPGAIVEVSNPRTGRGFHATADASGAFVIDAEAERGDTLKVLSRKIQFRRAQPPQSSAVVSSP
ncbi:MAG: hypothetical protein ACT4PK_00240 [Gammaproteobacteria bacterium]